MRKKPLINLLGLKSLGIIFSTTLILNLFSCKEKDGNSSDEMTNDGEITWDPIKVFANLELNVPLKALSLEGFLEQKEFKLQDNHTKIFVKGRSEEEYGSLLGRQFDRILIKTLNDSVEMIQMEIQGGSSDFRPYGFLTKFDIDQIETIFLDKYGEPKNIEKLGFNTPDSRQIKWDFPSHEVLLEIVLISIGSFPNSKILEDYRKFKNEYFSAENSVEAIIEFEGEARKKFGYNNFDYIDETDNFHSLKIIFKSKFLSNKSDQIEKEKASEKAVKDSILLEREKGKLK